jgi:hypothetical protein
MNDNTNHTIQKLKARCTIKSSFQSAPLAVTSHPLPYDAPPSGNWPKHAQATCPKPVLRRSIVSKHNPKLSGQKQKAKRGQKRSDAFRPRRRAWSCLGHSVNLVASKTNHRDHEKARTHMCSRNEICEHYTSVGSLWACGSRQQP